MSTLLSADWVACAELGLPVATDLSESQREVEYLTSGGGDWGSYSFLVPSPGEAGVRLLADLLAPGLVLAHCAYVDVPYISWEDPAVAIVLGGRPSACSERTSSASSATGEEGRNGTS